MKGSNNNAHTSITPKTPATKIPSPDNDSKPPAREIVVSPVHHHGREQPSVEECCDSTSTVFTPVAHVTAATPGSVDSLHNNRSTDKHHNESATQQQQQQQQHHDWNELVLLAGTAFLSFITFLYLMLPFTALLALLVCSVSWVLLMYTLYGTAVHYGQALLAGQGIGDYLPTWLYDLLTTTSLHEYLTDPTFGLENRHLLLYFMPLEAQQLQAYLQRLAPHHQAVLQRTGLGHFLGRNFMRWIQGDERYHADDDAPSSTAAIVPASTPRPLLLEDDDNDSMDLGLHVTAHDLAGGLNDTQTVGMARSLGLANPATTSSSSSSPATTTRVAQQQQQQQQSIPPDLQQAYNEEEQVLIEAFSSAVWTSVWIPIVNFCMDQFVQAARPVTRRMVRYGFGIFLVSSGVACFSYYARPTSRYSQTAWTTAMLSGTTTSLVFGLQWWWYGPPRDTPPTTQKPKSE